MADDRVERAAVLAYETAYAALEGWTWKSEHESARSRYRQGVAAVLAVADEEFGAREARYLARIADLVERGDEMARLLSLPESDAGDDAACEWRRAVEAAR